MSQKIFFGIRYEANIGADFGFSLGVTALYAPVPNTSEFVIGVGAAIGFGVSATIIDANGGIGTTKRAFPWRNY